MLVHDGPDIECYEHFTGTLLQFMTRHSTHRAVWQSIWIVENPQSGFDNTNITKEKPTSRQKTNAWTINISLSYSKYLCWDQTDRSIDRSIDRSAFSEFVNCRRRRVVEA